MIGDVLAAILARKSTRQGGVASSMPSTVPSSAISTTRSTRFSSRQAAGILVLTCLPIAQIVPRSTDTEERIVMEEPLRQWLIPLQADAHDLEMFRLSQTQVSRRSVV